MSVAYRTQSGMYYHGLAEEILCSPDVESLRGNVDLIFTSPPFPLNRKKKYGNLQGQEYIDWLSGFSTLFKQFLAPKGSIVIEMGNSWEPGHPVMSTLALRSLLAFHDAGDFYLCQQFIWHNSAKLPGPAQWVNIERIRVKDAYTHLWWMSSTDRPKAHNRRVLTEYSPAMKRLLKKKKYNPGPRPSEHNIGEESFLQDNQGAIPPNVIIAPNTRANTDYLKYCKENELTPHPARMPMEVAEFFVKFLTEPNDLVLDPFAGSNVTGAAAEKHGRRWIAIEADEAYVEGSKGRFPALFLEEE